MAQSKQIKQLPKSVQDVMKEVLPSLHLEHFLVVV